MSKKPYVLIIRDGWGYNPDFRYNAVYNAQTPNHDKYLKDYPTALIVPSGENVGLPSGNQGSSEVGHLNMGAGRVVYQSLVRITNTILNGDFFKIKPFLDAMNKVKEKGSTLHLWGLVQDQGVHAHNEHCIALLELAAKIGLKKDQVVIHVFSDGRDTPPRSTEGFIRVLDEATKKHGVGVIGSVVGRYYAMDRDTNWERIKIAYDMLTTGNVPKFDDVYAAVADAYAKDENDEFIMPRITSDFKPVSDNDSIIFFNYRLDRTREMTKAFVLDGFNEFPTKDIKNLDYVCFTEYYDGVASSSRANVQIAFPNVELTNLFGQYLADHGMTQLRIAETEKFAHVTFFFNGQSDVQFANEERILVPSPKVETYDLQPEMSAYEVKDKAVDAINSGKYDVVILNYANPDMVGHTGVYDAAVKACTVVDECVGAVVDAALANDGVVLVTADHGNAEQMVDYITGKPMTSHTTNLVWLSLISNRPELQKDKICLKVTGGRLADLIPTMIECMGMEKPADMEGESLIRKLD